MEAYLKYKSEKNNNVLLNSWETYKAEHYQFDETINYFQECMEYEDARLKKGYWDRGREKFSPEAFAAMVNQIYFGINNTSTGGQFKKKPVTPEECDQRAYKNWLYFKYVEFVKNYKYNRGVQGDKGLVYYFITLNFKPDAEMDKVKYHVERFVRMGIFKGCKITYSYEYYTDQGFHPHVHILVELNRTGQIERVLSKVPELAFKDKSLKPILNHNEAIDIKASHFKNDGEKKKKARPREECLAYIGGRKSLKKEENSNNDVSWREQNKLQSIYLIECV